MAICSHLGYFWGSWRPIFLLWQIGILASFNIEPKTCNLFRTRFAHSSTYKILKCNCWKPDENQFQTGFKLVFWGCLLLCQPFWPGSTAFKDLWCKLALMRFVWVQNLIFNKNFSVLNKIVCIYLKYLGNKLKLGNFFLNTFLATPWNYSEDLNT